MGASVGIQNAEFRIHNGKNEEVRSKKVRRQKAEVGMDVEVRI
jgi:hypothetical protein